MQRSLKFFLWCALTWAVCLTAPLAKAASQDDLQRLNNRSFSVKMQAIKELGASGDRALVPALTALLEGNLYGRKTDNMVVIGQKSGQVYLLIDPLSGQELGQVQESALAKIGINNRLRRLIRGALGGLTLLSKDPALRLQAAQSIFNSRDVELLESLQQAIAREEDATILAAMQKAQAVIELFHGESLEKRKAAVILLEQVGGQDVRALLSQLVQEPDLHNNHAELYGVVKAALERVEERLRLWNMVGSLFQGISLGSVLLLAAVGLAITFGVMGVINMAHGELVMLGAYTTFVVQDLFRAYLPDWLDWSLLVAVPMAFLVSGLFGVAIERGIIRFLYGRPLETLLATWGLSLMLQQLVRTLFGPTNQEVSNPSWMSGAIQTSQGLVLTYNRITIILFSLAVIGSLALVLRKTSLGLQMRAVTQNRRMAGSMGIRTGWVDALTFGLGAGIAGIAGVALSQVDNVSPNLGQSYIIDSFMVVVFGGVGNLWGTLVGAFSLGVLNKFMEPLAGAVLGKILVLVGIILFIQKRPRGLFALKGRAVEA
ncbi:urea ABC transporter permease subunit UrtB [Magnetococcus marinus]|nr:urea ABC transporter permease subunit UrtB [Magnetococcus marinus]